MYYRSQHEQYTTALVTLFYLLISLLFTYSARTSLRGALYTTETFRLYRVYF